MSEATIRITPGRIVVAVDASPHGLAALEEAVRLASRMQAELCVVFVEDEDLLHLAGLPFAREISALSEGRRLDPLSMSRALRVEAERVRRALEEAARRVEVNWSFQVARGRLVRELLAAALEADLLLTAVQRRAARAALKRAKGAASASQRPILALYDGTASGRRVLDHAAQLVSESGRPVYVLLAGKDSASGPALREEALSLLRKRGVEADAHSTVMTDGAALESTAWHAGAQMLLLNLDSPLIDESCLENLVNHLDCPVALVR